MAYVLKIKESVLKTLKKMEKTVKVKIWAVISELTLDPRPQGCVKMSGKEDLWRIRVGDWRIVYQIRDSEMVVLVVRVGHRREVYRQR